MNGLARAELVMLVGILPFVLFSLLADSIEAARIAIAVALNGILCHGSRALNSKSDIAAGCTCFDIACNVAFVLYINAVSPWSGTLPLIVVTQKKNLISRVTSCISTNNRDGLRQSRSWLHSSCTAHFESTDTRLNARLR